MTNNIKIVPKNNNPTLDYQNKRIYKQFEN